MKSTSSRKRRPGTWGRRGTFAGKPYEPFLLDAGVLLVKWLILWWMYRRKIFLRI